MREFIVANISMETNINDLERLFYSAGSVKKVQLFEDPYSNETKQYAIVTMAQNIRTYWGSLLHNSLVKNNIIIVLPAYKFRREYIDILYELKSLLSRDDSVCLKDAANFLIELECLNKHNFSRSKKILIKAIRVSALENQLNVNHVARTIENSLGPRNPKKSVNKKRSKRKRRKSRSIRAISTPMGGQPPRKRR